LPIAELSGDLSTENNLTKAIEFPKLTHAQTEFIQRILSEAGDRQKDSLRLSLKRRDLSSISREIGAGEGIDKKDRAEKRLRNEPRACKGGH